MKNVPAIKVDRQQAVPTAWRPTLETVVRSLAEGDSLGRIPNVELSTKRASQIAASVSAYGETLTALPEQTWESSIARWAGAHWDVLVDLWTEESGRSDLVMTVKVSESDEGFQFLIDGLYVP